MYFNHLYYNENNEIISIELICDICSNKVEIKNDKEIFSVVKDDYCIVKNGSKIICSCGNRCQSGTVESKNIQYPKSSNIIYNLNYNTANNNATIRESSSKPHCPYCNSTNLKRITMTAKAVNIAMFGLLGNKRKYQWHCNNCKTDF